MEVHSLAGIALDPQTIAKQLRLIGQGIVPRVIEVVAGAIEPVAAFRSGDLQEKRDDGVVIDGVHFRSRVLRHNLDGVGRVFPFVLTVGEALDKIIAASDSMLEQYLLDEIGTIALNHARIGFEHHLRHAFALEKISCMAPGALDDWPLGEQKPLFSLLNGVEAAIGVRLTDRCLMIPRKSISGIYFSSHVSFFSCQLCPRERCGGRKARYDEAKARNYGL